MDEFDAELLGEGRLDLLALAEAHETGVDEDAGELGADGADHQRRGDRGVDPTRERTQHLRVAHPLADGGDLFVDDRGVGPRRRDAGQVVQEVRNQLLAAFGVGDLGVELHRVTPRRVVLHDRDRRAGRRSRDHEAVGRARDRVAVTHPARTGLGPSVNE